LSVESKSKSEIGIDANLIKVLSHPARWYALDILNQRMASPKELAREIGIEVGLMSYHVKELKKYDFVELVKTAPRRGAVEHFYKATKRAIFSDTEWATIPENLRSTIVGNELKKTGDLLEAALKSGNFEARGNRHHSLCESTLDAQGWDESMALLEETLARLLEIQAESAERRIGSDEPGVPMAISIVGFEKAS
jgi:DNA-binding transcriptional regulator GbsR (MarR family)